MTQPEADGRDVDETQEAFGGLVVAGGDAAGVFQPVEAAFDEVAQPVEGAIHRHPQLAGFPHGDHRQHVARLHGLANIVRIVAAIGQQDGGLGQVVGHHQIEAEIVRCLAGRDLRPHRQAGTVDAEVDLGREATPRTAETLARSPPFAPAA